MTGLTDAKTELVSFLEQQVTALADRVTTTFPDRPGDLPWCVLDAVTGQDFRGLTVTKASRLVRITVAGQDDLTVDTITDAVTAALDTGAADLTVVKYGGVQYQGPIKPVIVNGKPVQDAVCRETDIKAVFLTMR